MITVDPEGCAPAAGLPGWIFRLPACDPEGFRDMLMKQAVSRKAKISLTNDLSGFVSSRNDSFAPAVRNAKALSLERGRK